MLEMLLQWYRRRFTDPQAIALLAILVVGFCILYFAAAFLRRCCLPSFWRICWNGPPFDYSAVAARARWRCALC